MIGTNNCFEFRRWYHEERHSKDNKNRQKHSQGQILTTLTILEYEIQKESMSSYITNTMKRSRHKRTENI